jgi:ribosomal-protein-alanine N-acetyltransferase
MQIIISDNILITKIFNSDKDSYIKHLNNPLISQYMSRMPYPYTESDATCWLGEVEKNENQHGIIKDFAIRANNDLIGGISLFNYVSKSHKAELGYWLAQEFWGQGLMLKIINEFLPWIVEKFKITRIEANVFDKNVPSQKVLLKAEFELEGVCKKYYFKDGQYFDKIIFAKFFPYS